MNLSYLAEIIPSETVFEKKAFFYLIINIMLSRMIVALVICCSSKNKVFPVCPDFKRF
jgi:hypothetical protein